MTEPATGAVIVTERTTSSAVVRVSDCWPETCDDRLQVVSADYLGDPDAVAAAAAAVAAHAGTH